MLLGAHLAKLLETVVGRSQFLSRSPLRGRPEDLRMVLFSGDEPAAVLPFSVDVQS